MNIQRFSSLVFFLLLIPFLSLGQSLQLADSLFEKGRRYDKSGNKKQSEFYYREAYNIYRDFQDTASWLLAGKEYASAMVFRSKNEQAMELYQMLLEVDHPANDTYNRGDLYTSMGWSSNRLDKSDQALEYYDKALPLAIESEDSLLIGTIYNNLGAVHRNKGNNSQALEFYQKALTFYNEKRYRTVALSNIGNIYSDLYLYDKALEYYNGSLKLSKEIDSILRLAWAFTNIGDIQRKLGNFDQSLIAYKQSLDYSRRTSSPRLTTTILNNLGLLYKKLGKYEIALDYYQQSLAIKKEISGPTTIATTTNNLGLLFWEMGQKKEAREYYVKALKLRRQIGNPYDIYYSMNAMIKLAFDLKDYEQALEYTKQIKALGDSTGSFKMLARASTYFGQINAAKNQDDEALQDFKRAYSYSRSLPPRRQLEPLKNLSEHYHKLGSDSAIVYGQQAIEIIEKTRSNVGALSELKSSYFGKHSSFYIQLASWVLEYESDIPRAYKLIEQAKARSLSEELAKASQNIEERLPEKARIERNQKRKRIDRLYSELESTVNKQEQAQIREEIRSAELDYAAYENTLHEEHSGLKSLKSPDPISLEQAKEITDNETAALEYAIAGNQLIMFLISREDVRVEQFSLSNGQELASKLTSWVANFKDAILSNASRSKLRSESNKLYEVLIKPFEDELDKFSNLIIVPDGALAYLPFEAISQGDQYLIENFKIKYEPSLTSLTLLKEPKPTGQKQLLAVAGSQFSETNSRSSRLNKLSALPSTLIEVDSIASHFQKVSMLKNEEVSEQAFKNLLQKNRYQYIHLATHGFIDENQPNRSGLALSSEGGVNASSKEDGMLRSSEIFGLDINSDMVVLSACNTGLGKVVGGEGMLGMQRSFFYAGTSTVIVSLWNVYDRSTASFMNEFYKALLYKQQGESWIDNTLRWIGWDDSIPFGQKASAMRQAKLEMIKHPLFNHPTYWAPFIVVGR